MAQPRGPTSPTSRLVAQGIVTPALLVTPLALVLACNTGPCPTGSAPVLNGGQCQCSDGTALAQRECKSLRDAGAGSEVGGAPEDGSSDAASVASSDAAALGALDAADATSVDAGVPVVLVPGKRAQIGGLTFLLPNGCADEATVQVDGVPLDTLPRASGYDRYAGAYDVAVTGVSAPCLRMTLSLTPHDDDGPVEILRDDQHVDLPVIEQTDALVTVAIDTGGRYTIVQHSLTVMLYDFESAQSTPAGDFQADDSHPATGQQAGHPVHLARNGASSIAFDCDGRAHTWLSFWHLALAPSQGQRLRFFVDDEERLTLDASSATRTSYEQASFLVARGAHVYRIEADVELPAQPPFWVDDIRCVDHAPDGAAQGELDFESGYVPAEMSGDFVIDNAEARSPRHAAHPPISADAGVASLALDCSHASKGELSFAYLAAPRSNGETLTLYVDDVQRETFPSTQNDAGVAGWTDASVTSARGGHRYRWDVRSESAGAAPFWLDDIRCE